jgi:hypothetical protein
MFLLFGKSMHPALRLIIAVAILVIGIVAHLELMEIATPRSPSSCWAAR